MPSPYKPKEYKPNQPKTGTGGKYNFPTSFDPESVPEGTNAKFIKHEMRVFTLPKINLDDDEAVEARLQEYFNICFEDDMKPTVAGMAGSLGVNRGTLRLWYNGERRGGTPRVDIIKKYYDFLESLWENYMGQGAINPVSGIFLAKNNFQYRDQQEVVVKENVNVAALSTDEILKSLPDTAPSGVTLIGSSDSKVE